MSFRSLQVVVAVTSEIVTESCGQVAEAVGVPPRAAVIIPHLNTPEDLRKCLDSVLRQKLDHGTYEILVVDNGSAIPLTSLEHDYPKVLFLVELRPGPGPARNQGVSAARAPILTFIDADCRAEDGWLQAAVDAIEADPKRAVIGGNVKIDVVDPCRLTGLEVYETVFAFRQQHYIKTLGFSGTGNLAMSRVVYLEVGPFGGIEIAEDMDWGRRARDKGFPARYEPTMIVYHPSRGSLQELKKKWKRQISHAFVAHQRSGRTIVRWQASAFLVLISGVAHSFKIMTANELGGLAARTRGIATLINIRMWRFGKMLRIDQATRDEGSSDWNRL